MSKYLKFQIITPERVVFEAPEVEAVSLPTKMGEITILPDHLPLVASLVAGETRVKVSGKEILMAVSGGFIEVKPGEVVVLADSAERAEEIDITRAEEARGRAEKLMQEKKFGEAEDYTYLVGKLEKELARVKVAHKHRTHRSPLTHNNNEQN
ncbi:MAG: ATP synthase F1 subunit epsilon [Patescibacteria group bacterium]